MENLDALKPQNNEQVAASELKALQTYNQGPNGQNQTQSKQLPHANAQIKPQTTPVIQNEPLKEFISTETHKTSQNANSLMKISAQSQKQEPNHQSSQSQPSGQLKSFSIQLSDYLITFELSNSQLTIKAQKQTGRKCLKSSYVYSEFTQQMKALFESPQQMWAILESAQDFLFFQDLKLSFKIRLGGTEKPIHIPLTDHNSTDQQYIQKLERVAEKYKNLSTNLAEELQKQKNQCICKKQTPKPQTETQKKDINPKAKGKINIDRNWLSRASSTWPDAPINFKEKEEQDIEPHQIGEEDDPLTQFEQLIQKLNMMRDNYNLLLEEIEQKILASAGIKILKLKLLGLEKKKKDFFYELDLEKIKFVNLKCRDDIYNEIDQFLDQIRQKYSQIQTTVNLIRDDK